MSRARQRKKLKEKARKKAAAAGVRRPGATVWEVGIRPFRAAEVLCAIAPEIADLPGFEQERQEEQPAWAGLVLVAGPDGFELPLFGEDAEEIADLARAAVEERLEDSEPMPEAVAFNHPVLGEHLRAIRDRGVRLLHEPKMLRLDRRLNEMIVEGLRQSLEDTDTFSDEPAARPPTRSLHRGTGGEEDLVDFHAAARAFATAEGWARAPQLLVLEVLEPTPPEGMTVLAVHCGEEASPRMAFWTHVEHFEASKSAVGRGERPASGGKAWGLVLVPPESLTPNDRGVVRRLGLEPIDCGGEPRMPLFHGRGADGAPRQVTPEHLFFVTRLMEALAMIVDAAERTGDHWGAPMDLTCSDGVEKIRFRFRPVEEDPTTDPSPPHA